MAESYAAGGLHLKNGQKMRNAKMLGLVVASALAMMLAVMHRHGGLNLADQDVFVNVVGGIRISETGADLPLILALQSSFRNRALPPKWVCFGEVGLSGEVRPVYDGTERLKAALGHGYETAILPLQNAPRQGMKGLRLHPVTSVAQALELVAGIEPDDRAGRSDVRPATPS